MPRQRKVSGVRSRRERRAHQRVSVDASTTVVGPDARAFTGQSRDISLGGICVEASLSVARGTRVEVTLDLDGERIGALAEVVRADAGKVALRFLELDPTALHSILRLVGAQSRRAAAVR